VTDAQRVVKILAQLQVLLAPAPLGEDEVRIEDWSAWTWDQRDGYFTLKQELTLETVHDSDAERVGRLVANLRRLFAQAPPGDGSVRMGGWVSRWSQAQLEAYVALKEEADAG